MIHIIRMRRHLLMNKNLHKAIMFMTTIILCFVTSNAMSSAPSRTEWIDGEAFKELKLWDSDNYVSGIYTTVRFGGHNWVTAGYDQETDGMVLLCAPSDSYGKRAFDSDTQSNYANIYRNSDIRTYLTGEALAEFSETEQENMLITHGEYLPESGDKLYLPNGVNGATFFSVGASDDIKVNITNGLFRSVSDRYWLRAPYTTGSKALAVSPGYYVTSTTTDVYNKYLIYPAFCLNCCNLLFASAAQPGKPSAELEATVESPLMTLRYQDVSTIRCEAFYSSETIIIQGESEQTYLYIQGRDNEGDFVYSIKAEDGLTIVSDSVCAGVDFRTCKIWLESNNEQTNLVVAKMAREYIPIGQITLDKDHLELPIGEAYALTASVLPTDATIREIKWVVDDERIADVDNGLVTMKAAGTTRLTAYAADGQSAECSITSLHTVSWMDDNTVIKADAIPYGSIATYDGDLPSREGFKFLHWLLNEEVYTASNPITDDLIISAEWFAAKGSCGNGVFYSMDENGVLTISGKGLIDNNAFTDNPFLRHVTIMDGVIGIKNDSFTRCINLTTISLPGGIDISPRAFNNTSISSVIINGDAPTGVTTETFLSTTKLYAPDKAEGFMVYPWSELNVRRYYSYFDLFVNNQQLITLPAGITEVNVKAFYRDDSITAVYVHDGVKSIKNMAFSECDNLYGIRMPNSISLENIADDAFIDSDNMIIYGFSASDAETYAYLNAIPFVSIEEQR